MELKSNLLGSALLCHWSWYLYRACSIDNAWSRMLFCSCRMTERSSAWQRSFHTTSLTKSHTALPGPSGVAGRKKNMFFHLKCDSQINIPHAVETNCCPHRTSEYPRLWLWEVGGCEGKLRGHSDFQTCKLVKYCGTMPRHFLYYSDRTLVYSITHLYPNLT